VSCTFLHGNLLHLFVNCQALASLGPFVENNAGHARFLAIYATSAVAGSVASYMFCPSLSVGASGGDCSWLLGPALLMLPCRRSSWRRSSGRRCNKRNLFCHLGSCRRPPNAQMVLLWFLGASMIP